MSEFICIAAVSLFLLLFITAVIDACVKVIKYGFGVKDILGHVLLLVGYVFIGIQLFRSVRELLF